MPKLAEPNPDSVGRISDSEDHCTTQTSRLRSPLGADHQRGHGGDSGFQSAVARDGRNHAHSVKTRLAETAHGIAPRLIGAGGVAVFCGSGGKRYKPSAIARPTSAIAPTNTPTPSQPCEA